MAQDISKLPAEMLQQHIFPYLKPAELIAFALTDRRHFWNVFDYLKVDWLKGFSEIWQVSAAPTIKANIFLNHDIHAPNIAPRQVWVAYLRRILQNKIGLNANQTATFLNRYQYLNFYTAYNAVNFVEIFISLTSISNASAPEMFLYHFKKFFLKLPIGIRKSIWYQLARKKMFDNNTSHYLNLDPLEIANLAHLSLTSDLTLPELVHQARHKTIEDLLKISPVLPPPQEPELTPNEIYHSLKGDFTLFVRMLWRTNLNIEALYNGISLLHMAVQVRASMHARFLLDLGMEANIIDEAGNTPLHYAAEKNLANMIGILLTYGANPNIQNTQGNTPLNICANLNKIVAFENLLLSGANPCLYNNHGNMPLHAAAKHNHIGIIKKLEKNGISITTLNRRGENALHVAARFGADHVLEALLLKGFNINQQSHRGNTALHLAVISGKPHIVRLLLSYNPNPEINNINQATPLGLARSYGNPQIIHLLESYVAEHRAKYARPVVFLYPHPIFVYPIFAPPNIASLPPPPLATFQSMPKTN